jgi:hypothetical protein
MAPTLKEIQEFRSSFLGRLPRKSRGAISARLNKDLRDLHENPKGFSESGIRKYFRYIALHYDVVLEEALLDAGVLWFKNLLDISDPPVAPASSHMTAEEYKAAEEAEVASLRNINEAIYQDRRERIAKSHLAKAAPLPGFSAPADNKSDMSSAQKASFSAGCRKKEEEFSALRGVPYPPRSKAEVLKRRATELANGIVLALIGPPSLFHSTNYQPWAEELSAVIKALAAEPATKEIP